jgi:hypothetical protein
VLTALHQHHPSIAVGIVGNDLVVADTPMHKISATMTELIRKLKDNKVERIAFERGVTQDELVALVQNLSAPGRQGRRRRRQGSLQRARPRRPAEERRRQEAGRHRERHRRDPPDVLERRRLGRGAGRERGDRGHARHARRRSRPSKGWPTP